MLRIVSQQMYVVQPGIENTANLYRVINARIEHQIVLPQETCTLLPPEQYLSDVGSGPAHG